MDKIETISAVSAAIDRLDDEGAKAILRAKYPFEPITRSGGGVSPHAAARVFMRDGFIDRYSGKRLVYPGALRAISILCPEEFPHHRNWKMDACHFAYYEICAVVDHLVPRTRGGKNDESNLVTTSTIRNSAKANFTLEELGWKLLPGGDLEEWDGLLRWFVRTAGRRTEVLSLKESEPDAWIWYEAGTAALMGRSGPWR